MSNTKQMKTPVINFEDKTIEMTAKYHKTAGHYNSDQYKELQAIRAEHPDYTIVVKTTNKQSPDNKGLTYANMKKYIESIEDAAGLEEYERQRKKAKGVPTSADGYQHMKKWFEKKYPEYCLFQSKKKKHSQTDPSETALPALAPANT